MFTGNHYQGEVKNMDRIYNYEPLFGGWKIEKLLGEGGFGKVYRIYKDLNKKRVYSAAKIITIPSDEEIKNLDIIYSTESDETRQSYINEIVERITSEVELLYTLRGHSNIINYEDHIIEKINNEEYWNVIIKMEYATPLKDYIGKKRLDTKDILKLGIDISEALSFCYTNNIIHRDIKESNIFITDNNIFKLGDFGVSRNISDFSRASTRVGTISYMAPEVFKGEKYNIKADIYSLGLLLYKLLNYNRLPFLPVYPEKFSINDLEISQTKRYSGEDFPKISDCSDDIYNIITKACAFNPSNRYEDPIQLKNNLLMLLNNKPIPVKNTITIKEPNKTIDKKSIPKVNSDNTTIIAENNKSDEEEGFYVNLENNENNIFDYTIDARTLKTDKDFSKIIDKINTEIKKPKSENKSIFTDETEWASSGYKKSLLNNKKYTKSKIEYSSNSAYKIVSAGDFHNVVLGNDNKLKAWGSNIKNQCEIPTFNGNSIKNISCGVSHNLLLTVDGRIYAWGANELGQCNIPEYHDVKYIAAGGFHSLILKDDYTVYGFGDNTYGQSSKYTMNEKIICISAGDRHSILLTESGKLFAWGSNDDGQCDIPKNLGKVKYVSAGAYHNIVITEDNRAVAWGYNAYKQCNIPENIKNVSKVSAGFTFSMILLNEGTVKCFGSFVESTVPKGMGKIVEITSGRNHSLVINENGNVILWGKNTWEGLTGSKKNL
jgi:serine/threonine protein kinase